MLGRGERMTLTVALLDQYGVQLMSDIQTSI